VTEISQNRGIQGVGLIKDGASISKEALIRMMAKILENEDLIEKLFKKISEVFN